MKNPFLKISCITIFLFISIHSISQVIDTASKNKLIKINVPALFLKNISLQYEHALNKKHAFAIAVRFRPKSSMPFQSTIENIIDQKSVRVDLFKMGNIGITPEYRFYVGKKKALQGFYIAPFISYNHYTGDIPVNYMNDAKTGVFIGSINTYTAGFQLGAQWKLNEHLSLDWWILGPNYGKSKGDFLYAAPLDDTEQISVDFELFRIQEGTNPRIMKSYTVNANGASFVIDGSWGGLRAMGLCLGYRF